MKPLVFLNQGAVTHEGFSSQWLIQQHYFKACKIKINIRSKSFFIATIPRGPPRLLNPFIKLVKYLLSEGFSSQAIYIHLGRSSGVELDLYILVFTVSFSSSQ